jgi:ketosteroid isomerase-like protein
MGSSSSLTVAQQGFDAWRRGDFDALEAIFAPDVEWRWFEPGDWDCHSRDDVVRTLRQRHAAGFAEGRLNFTFDDIICGVPEQATQVADLQGFRAL